MRGSLIVFVHIALDIYFSQKQPPRKKQSRLIIIKCAGYILWQLFSRRLYFVAVVFASTIFCGSCFCVNYILWQLFLRQLYFVAVVFASTIFCGSCFCVNYILWQLFLRQLYFVAVVFASTIFCGSCFCVNYRRKTVSLLWHSHIVTFYRPREVYNARTF